ncbi:MAG: TIGR03088 family PEP-CTERM/XrtA system glycosyltransferase [Halioglobus sp.]|nr:TIGR03088 family PEP-CTERM/XrtA system glycosyltransferase [Halioglobus sp.]
MDDRPLVAHIIYALSTGGLENGLVNIINRSPPQRYRHVIICLTTADEFAHRIQADNVTVIELHKREGYDLHCYAKLRRLLKELRPAIIHSRNMAALESQLCSLWLPGIKRVHGEHGREVNDLDGSNWKYLAFRRCMRLFIHRYIAVSKDLAQWLVAKVGVSAAKVRQIYNGVDHSRFTPETVKPLALLPAQWQQHDGILVAGTVGRLTPVKDQQLLLRAVATLRESDPGLAARLRLIIVGDGPLYPQLEQLVEQLALQDCVWMPGDRKDVPDLLQVMDVFVLPSLGEGISNTVLEAMASGLPVIATAVGGNVELVEEGCNGSLVPAGDHRALANALAALLTDDGQRIRQGHTARERVCQRFDWDRTVSAYLQVYDELLGRSTVTAKESTG